MAVHLLYFAWVREKVGMSGEAVEVTAPTPLGDLLALVAQQSAGHLAGLGDKNRLRAAINQQFCGWDAIVHDDDEVAFFPPVTGG